MKKFRTATLMLAMLFLAIGAVFQTDTVTAQDEDGEDLTFGLVLHFTGPFTDQIADGARSAAEELGFEVEVVATPGFDGQALIGLFESLVQTGVDGIAVVPNPPEIWAGPIEEAQEAGIPVVTLNVYAEDTPAPSFFGEGAFRSGQILGETLLDIYEGDSGKVVVGECAPGVPVLIERFEGLRSAIEEAGGFEIEGPFDVGIEPTENYSSWQNLLSAHPDADMMVGLCATDMPNLTRLRENTGAEFIAGGYDLEPAALEGISLGFGEVTIGQNPYLQGYLPMLALYRNITEGVELPEGWIDVGVEVVTAENVEELIAREDSLELTREFYASIIEEEYSDLSEVAQPYPGLGDEDADDEAVEEPEATEEAESSD